MSIQHSFLMVNDGGSMMVRWSILVGLDDGMMMVHDGQEWLMMVNSWWFMIV